MTDHLSAELFWLTATILMTALFWAPYILNRIAEAGLWGTLRTPEADARPRAGWADRMRRAHANAVENLVIFAPLVITAEIAGRTGALTAAAALVYFVARAAHFLVYSAGVPLARTLAFAAGVGAQIVIALAIFGVL